jgi:organic radical activating enzyme
VKIAEVFASVQGEGLRQGLPVLFVRLAGCNLRCRFCDTKRALRGGRETTEAALLRRLETMARRAPGAWVCLTGGEPLLQDVGGLVTGLRRRGLRVQLETNGTLFRRVPFDWVAVSPKPPSYISDPRWRARADEVKLVASRGLTFAVLDRLRRSFPARTPILLQPESNRPESRRRALRLHERSAKAGLPNIRLALQLHRIYKIK